MDKFITTNNIFSYEIKSAEQPKLLTEVGGSHIWDYTFALCNTSAVPSQNSVSSGQELERRSVQMALQAGSSQAFRAPLTLESLEGTRRARQEGKNSVGETNLSSLDSMSNKAGGKLDHLREGPAVLAQGAIG